MLKNQEDRPPNCYGELFSKTAAECVGGYDTAYQENGHIRARCDFVGTCSAKVQERQRQQPLIPASSLTSRPFTEFRPPPASPSYPRPTQAAVPPGPLYPPRPIGYPPPVQVPQHGFSGAYGIPQYLSVREPVTSGGLGKRMGLEILRSLGKSFGHTVANFFDSEIFGFKPEPPRRDDENNGQR